VIFCSLGSNVIIFLSAILSIDKTIFDAARIDGANEGQVQWMVVVPLIMPSIALVGLLSAIGAFQIFENIYALAPQNYAATMTYFIYQTSFMFSKYGLGAAEAVVLLIIVLTLSLIRKKVENHAD
jgi:multiple sugar transport system permease protein